MTAAPSILYQSREFALDLDTSSSDVYIIDNMSLQLDSPSSSSYCSDKTYRPSCSTSSVDGSRPGSDRFVLAGDFSSCESEAFISGTSESSDNEATSSSQPLEKLEKLRTMLRANGPTVRNKRHRTPVPVIVISSSSESSDDDDDDSSPLHMFSSTFIHSSTPLPESYIVSIPLSHLKSYPTSKPKKVPAKLALSHFATTRKKQSNESSGEEFFTPSSELPKSLSMKLKKSGNGNQWQSILLGDSQLPVSSPTMLDKHTPTYTLSSPLISKATAKGTSASNPNKLRKMPYITMKKQSIASNSAQQSTTVAPHLQPVMTASKPQSSSATSSDPPSVTSDLLEGAVLDTMSSDHQDDDLVSVSSSSSQTATTNYSRFRPRTAAPPPKASNGPVNVKKVNTTICFEELFAFYPSSLTFIDGELRPVNSLSLKGVEIVPRDHPIHKWKMGKIIRKSQPGPKKSKHKNVHSTSTTASY